MSFLGPKWPICPEQYFFGTNHYYYFHLPIGPFHCTKVKKNYSGSSYEDAPFWSQNGPFATNKNCLRKLLISFSSTIGPFHCTKNFLKIFQQIESYEMHNFWVQNGAFPHMRIFFQKTC